MHEHVILKLSVNLRK